MLGRWHIDFLATPTHLLFLLVVVLLFFGSTRLPKLARSLREARDEFNKGSTGAEPPAPTVPPAGDAPTPTAPPAGDAETEQP